MTLQTSSACPGATGQALGTDNEAIGWALITENNTISPQRAQLVDAAIAAIEYARRGWPVFPCSIQKKPMTRNGFKDATTDEQTIQQWWSKTPQSSIGIATGSVPGLLVLDVDFPDGPDSLSNLEGKHGPLPATLEQRTGSGGRHLIFKNPVGVTIKNSAGKIGPNLDIRCEGGYIIVPPSRGWNSKTGCETGTQYKWVNDHSIAEAPGWLVDMLRFEEKPISKAQTRPTPSGPRLASAYGQAALGKEITILAETPEGQRNAQVNKAAFSLAQLVGGGDLDRERVETELLAAAVSIGLSDTEARATIKSGMDAGTKKPRTAPLNVEEWPEHPVSLIVPDLPSFTVEDFPLNLGNMVFAASKANETPPELAGLMGLSVVATACQRRLTVEPEPGYQEPLNIWTSSALGPGNRKSAVVKVMASPLTAWEIEQAQVCAPLIRSVQLARDSQEARLKEMQKQFAKEKNEGKRQEISKQMEELSSKLQEVPVKPQIMAQDITPERLGTLMALHGERMGLFSAEGGIFDIIGGRYTNNGNSNLDIFLQSHSGDSVRVDRGSREPVWLKAPALTMGLCVQPDVIKGLASKPGFRGRGLVGRFLFALPNSPLGHRTLESKSIPADTEFLYKRTIRTLLEMPLPEGDIPIIRLSPEALQPWKEFQRWVETGLAEDGEFEHMRDWAGKLPGAAARIAGLFHCYEHEGKQPQTHPVSLQTMNQALSLARKLSRHALAAYDLMGADAAIEGARKVLRWIIRNGSVSFTGHDCHYALKSTFKRRAELDPALQVLIERGHIRKVEAQGEKRPGRPPGSGNYEVHPSIQSR